MAEAIPNCFIQSQFFDIGDVSNPLHKLRNGQVPDLYLIRFEGGESRAVQQAFIKIFCMEYQQVLKRFALQFNTYIIENLIVPRSLLLFTYISQLIVFLFCLYIVFYLTHCIFYCNLDYD